MIVLLDSCLVYVVKLLHVLSYKHGLDLEVLLIT